MWGCSAHPAVTSQISLAARTERDRNQPVKPDHSRHSPGCQCRLNNGLWSGPGCHGYSWWCFPDQGNANEHFPLFGYALGGYGVFGPRGDGGVRLSNDGPGCFRGTEIVVFSSDGDPSVVPAPLPLLGAVAALRWSRRLRIRLRYQGSSSGHFTSPQTKQRSTNGEVIARNRLL
jgi:MYXO-CTERM domain-containing protein